jgi:hypothetical protein
MNLAEMKIFMYMRRYTRTYRLTTKIRTKHLRGSNKSWKDMGEKAEMAQIYSHVACAMKGNFSGKK